MIRLEAYKLEHLTALFNLQLPPEQEEFTALPKDLIADVQDDPQRLGVTILKDDQPIGFFVLSVGEHRDKYLTTPDPDGVALGALSLDVSQQGQGVATQAMQALLAFVPIHFPSAKHVLLVVNQRNPVAKRVYEKAGFTVLGERVGHRGPQWIMTLPL